MAGRMTMVIGLAGTCLIAAAQSAAGEDVTVTVTVHVEDYASLDQRDWLRVKQVVGAIFDEVGVPVKWAGPLRVSRPDWPRDGQCRVALVVTNIEVPFAGDPGDRADILGRAAPEYSRAWVFANRVRRSAALASVDPAQLLARVIAHEIGHLLLPGEAHGPLGIMKGALAPIEMGFFAFTREQGASMQARIRRNQRQTR